MKNNRKLMVYADGKNHPTIISVTDDAMKFFEHMSDEGIAKTVLNIAAYCCPELHYPELLEASIELIVYANEQGDNWDVKFNILNVVTIE